MNPLYIIVPNEQKDKFMVEIYNMISKCIININEPYSCDLDFRILDKKIYMGEREVIVKNNVNSVVEILTNYNMLIYQKSTGKYWCRYYIECKEISNKGSEYSIEDIKCYIEQMFENETFQM
jgi:hypothetical protein